MSFRSVFTTGAARGYLPPVSPLNISEKKLSSIAFPLSSVFRKSNLAALRFHCHLYYDLDFGMAASVAGGGREVGGTLLRRNRRRGTRVLVRAVSTLTHGWGAGAQHNVHDRAH